MVIDSTTASGVVTVGLGERSYDIRIGSGLLDSLGAICNQAGIGKNLALITNPTIAALYLERSVTSLKSAGFSVTVIQIPDGEQHKNLDVLASIFEGLISGGIDRGGTIVALGGGVVGDIAGFAAATFLRGIPFIQVPTTLLAQVDSSVGGKTGINVPKGKNLVGAFYQPKLVVIDVSTLNTLSEREYISGLAEVAKYGIVLDIKLFDFIEENLEGVLSRDNKVLEKLVASCCRIKAAVVEQDERESGLRAVLNYGHTLAHAVETLTGYKSYTHGEAVGIGMVAAAIYSQQCGFAEPSTTTRILALLEKLKLHAVPPLFTREEYRDAMFRDKKVRDGGITFVCNKGIGEFCFVRIEDLQPLFAACGIGG